MQDLIRIGTRKSRLALVQTNIVRQKIEEAFPGIQGGDLRDVHKG